MFGVVGVVSTTSESRQSYMFFSALTFFFVLFGRFTLPLPMLQKKFGPSGREWIYRLLFLACAVSIIVYFLPRDEKFNYNFDLNKPWMYGQLIATFDFPIYKEEAVIKREQDSLMKKVYPYFRHDAAVENTMLDRFKEDYRTRLNKLFPNVSYQALLERMLRQVYAAGILSSADYQQMMADSAMTIFVVKGKTAEQHRMADVFSMQKAYEHIKVQAGSLNLDVSLLSSSGLNEYLVPNLTYDAERSQVARDEVLAQYSWAKGMVVSGQKIIDRGEIVSEESYNILESLRKEAGKRNESFGQRPFILLGQILFVSLILGFFMLYLQIYRPTYLQNKRSLVLLFGLIVCFCSLTAFMTTHRFFSVYVIPYAMLPIVIHIFLDSRTAFFTHALTILICSIVLKFPHQFVLVQLVAGMTGILSLRELSQRSQLINTAFYVFLASSITYLAFDLMAENGLADVLTSVNRRMYTYFLINGFLLLFTYPLLFLLEKMFGFTSNVTLIELSNINNDLLRRLSETAPGTFQHSMQMANLASAAALQIGANSQLVRTGALYHDIGKMENPAFFTENQSGGNNPHKNLSYEQSARIIIGHITDGLKLAEKHNLPRSIVDFISTHHGLGKTKYFYISWQNEHPGETPDDSLFTYPGPNPFTKETAILMMADSVEAASRSLTEYTEESIGALIDRIIDSQVAEGYFKNCPITFKDIADVKMVFKEKLKIIYHTRISYPELKKEEA